MRSAVGVARQRSLQPWVTVTAPHYPITMNATHSSAFLVETQCIITTANQCRQQNGLLFEQENNIIVPWASWRLKSSETPLLVQQHFQANNKCHIRGRHHCSKFTSQKPVMRKVSPHADTPMYVIQVLIEQWSQLMWFDISERYHRTQRSPLYALTDDILFRNIEIFWDVNASRY